MTILPCPHRSIRSNNVSAAGSYSPSIPQVECIDKSKVRKPYEFGRKVSVVTTNARARVANPYVTPRHCWAALMMGTRSRRKNWALGGCMIERAYGEKEYRGQDAAKACRFFVYGQRRGIFGAIKRALRRPWAVEAVIVT